VSGVEVDGRLNIASAVVACRVTDANSLPQLFTLTERLMAPAAVTAISGIGNTHNDFGILLIPVA
jgi:hypothetical protein